MNVQTTLPDPLIVVLAALVAWVPSQAALARSPDTQRADELFARGKSHLAVGEYGQACPLLAESYRIDPATGSLLALALCHERDGRFASALQAYREAVTRAQAEGRTDRAQAAQHKVSVLGRRISTVTIDTTALKDTSGLEVRINGQQLERAELDTPLPVDGGSVRIEVSADGKLPWSTSISLRASGDSRQVVVPPLVPLAIPIPTTDRTASSTPVRRTTPATAARTDSHRTPMHWTGVGLLTTGAASIVTGLGLAVRAVRKDDASEEGCTDNICTAEGRDSRLAARAAGDAATVTLAAGAGLMTAGLVTHFVDRRRRWVAAAASCRLSADFWATPQTTGVSLRGAF